MIMTQKQAIQIFEQRNVRTVWDDEDEKWYFSVVDVVGVLTDSVDATAYWRKLKQRLKAEGNETVTNCHALKMPAADGKMRLTDVADTEQLFRLIQSIPSPKAEPFKLWMARVASDRIDQMQDPELSIQQAMTDYKRLGYSEQWINQRLKSIEVRKELTDEWQRRGVEGQQYATLTDIHAGVVGTDDQGLQEVQGFEEREPARQHDQYRVGAEHAGGGSHYRDFQTAATARTESKQARSPKRWQCSKGCPQTT